MRNFSKLFMIFLFVGLLGLTACSSGGGSDDDTSDDDTTVLDDDVIDDDTTPVDDDTTPVDDDTTPVDDDTTPVDDDTTPVDDDTTPVDDDTTPVDDDTTPADDDTTPVDDDTVTGQALEINGGTTGSDYIDRYYPFSGISSDPTMSWDANSAAGAAYGVRITSASYYEVWSYLDTTGHYQMVDWNTGYPVDCGAVSTGTWVTMELAFDYTALTADLSVDGTPTSCVGMMLGGGSPIATIEFIDWSDSGYGGITDIDNIVAVDGGSPAWTIDFESYSLGELPAPWASYFESGSSTMLVIAL